MMKIKDLLKRIDKKIENLEEKEKKSNDNIEEIKNYYKENGKSEILIKQLTKKYYNHPDIANEFAFYIKTKEFVEASPITECGYTAKKLFEEHNDKLNISGVFAMLITLREKPEEGLEIIKKNFPRK